MFLSVWIKNVFRISKFMKMFITLNIIKSKRFLIHKWIMILGKKYSICKQNPSSFRIKKKVEKLLQCYM